MTRLFYGATNTPQPSLIGKDGQVASRGVKCGGVLVNSVEAALVDLSAGRPVKVAESKAYGCSVKYAN